MRAHRSSSGILTVKWGWKCTWMTSTVLGQTHKWRSSRKILRHTSGSVIAEYDHLKRFRKRLNGAMTIESNPKYLDAVLELLGLEGAKDAPTSSVPAHKEKLTTGELLSPARTQCRDSVLEVCSTTRKTEQMHSKRCQSWDRCWENRLKDR